MDFLKVIDGGAVARPAGLGRAPGTSEHEALPQGSNSCLGPAAWTAWVSCSARGAVPMPGGLMCGQEAAAAACQGLGAGRPRLPALRARAEAEPWSAAMCRGCAAWCQPDVSFLKPCSTLFIALLLPLGQRKAHPPSPCSIINRKPFGIKDVPVPAEMQHEARGCRSLTSCSSSCTLETCTRGGKEQRRGERGQIQIQCKAAWRKLFLVLLQA